MRASLLTASLALLLAACATSTPYQPAQKGLGYFDQKLESNRYRVSFTGSPRTSRETVENYVMYRAAELTLQNGYDYFVVADRQTQSVPSSGSGLGFGFGLGSFGSSGGYSVGVGSDGGSGSAQYSSQADILMYRGSKPEGAPNAFDARAVMRNLEATIQRPSGY
jgi:uncharacterized membrane protein YgcG